MKLYMQVTKDKYELPMAVADSPSELSRMTGKTLNTICSSICKAKRANVKHCSYVVVEVEDE